MLAEKRALDEKVRMQKMQERKELIGQKNKIIYEIDPLELEVPGAAGVGDAPLDS